MINLTFFLWALYTFCWKWSNLIIYVSYLGLPSLMLLHFFYYTHNIWQKKNPIHLMASSLVVSHWSISTENDIWKNLIKFLTESYFGIWIFLWSLIVRHTSFIQKWTPQNTLNIIPIFSGLQNCIKNDRSCKCPFVHFRSIFLFPFEIQTKEISCKQSIDTNNEFSRV